MLRKRPKRSAGLAHATRVFEDPADIYAVLGDLLAGVRSLRQVLDQLASAHVRNQVRAYDDAGNQGAGASHALTAAADLRQTAVLLDGVHDQLDAAMGVSAASPGDPHPQPQPLLPGGSGSCSYRGRTPTRCWRSSTATAQTRRSST